MTDTTRVDFHCHSVYSDGVLTPKEVADRLAAAGVGVAALADHDTVDGLPAFAEALARRDVAFLTGVEITVQLNEEDAHLLAYGFDPHHRELQETLRSLRQARVSVRHSITDTLRARGSGRPGLAEGQGVRSAAPNGRLPIGDAIALVHRAGGRAFLAHPLVLQPDLERLEETVVGLKRLGLDGIEAFYGPASAEERNALYALARKHDLLSSGGSDFHDAPSGGGTSLGVEMPTEAWKEFRDAVCCRSPVQSAVKRLPGTRPPGSGVKWRHFAWHILLPTLLAIGLFVAAIFVVLLPSFERSLLDRKREMIRELTNSAWSILAEFERDVRNGVLTRAQAQEMARSRIEFLRYGREGKDYFWLQDLHPRMIMHPYRPDLNGQDLSNFRDPRGVRIFVEFAEVVRRQGEGYVAYVWQWKDDPSRLAPKESYVKGFAPWGWVIGTGIYIEDVREEIARIEQHLARTSMAIVAVVALLLLYVLQQGLRLERERAEAEEGLRESTERYRSLIEASTEGTLLVLDGRCRYANPPLLALLGYSEHELELLDVSDVLPQDESNALAHRSIARVMQGEDQTGGFEGVLRRRDGSRIECVLSVSPISFSGRNGFILLAKDLSPGAGLGDAASERRLRLLGDAADTVAVGLFRARAWGRGTIIAANRAAADFFPSAPETPAVADLFHDGASAEEFFAELARVGSAERLLHQAGEDGRTRVLWLRARMETGAASAPRLLNGVIEDITARARAEAEREALIERLQSSLLFLHQPVSHVSPPPVFCDLETSVQRVAALMAARGSSAALVRSESGTVLGIVTDRDLRVRVLAAGLDPRTPVHRVMSAPLITIREDARVYEALLTMEEHGVQHLALTDEDGRVVGVTRPKDLIQFHSYGAIVLTREIARAQTPEEVIGWCQRAPGLVQALVDCGASPRNITEMATAVCDAATVRFLTLAMEELGAAPGSFAFVALGSQGRREQTLASDQDNAIVFVAEEEGGEGADPKAYFLELGRRVCTWLDQAGYPLCKGEVMAMNPKWCQPLSAWKRAFREWIQKAEPQQLLEFSIFFDLRTVYGDAGLLRDLRSEINAGLRTHPAFFTHFAQNALLFRPPLGLFGQILSGSKASGQAGLLDLKEATMPLVSFARLYALRHDISETHTLGRLEALEERGILTRHTLEEMTAAYDTLMRFRLRQQAGAVRAGQTPDNTINHRRLGRMEETLLKQSFAQIAAAQKRVSFDFLGGT